MLRFLMIVQTVWVMLVMSAQAQSLMVDPESVVPLPDRFELEIPAADIAPAFARFQGAWIGTWYDDVRTILVVERVKPDGHAGIIFAHGDSGIYGMYREWWRSEAVIADGRLTIAGEAMKIPWLRLLQFSFDGNDHLYVVSTLGSGAVGSGVLVRTDALRLAAGERPAEWPTSGERVWIPHLTVRTPHGARSIKFEATYYPSDGGGEGPLAIVTHGSDAGRNQLRSWSFATEAHWLRQHGFAVLALMRRGRGRSEGINGEEDFGRDHDGGLVDVSAGIAQAVADLDSAIAFGRTLRGVKPGPVLLAGQSRGGFLAMHYAGLEPDEVMGVVNFSGGWYPYGPVTTQYYAGAGRGAAGKVPQLWLHADNDCLYDEALIR